MTADERAVRSMLHTYTMGRTWVRQWFFILFLPHMIGYIMIHSCKELHDGMNASFIWIWHGKKNEICYGVNYLIAQRVTGKICKSARKKGDLLLCFPSVCFFAALPRERDESCDATRRPQKGFHSISILSSVSQPSSLTRLCSFFLRVMSGSL